jgi:hypothetical protein
MNRDAMAIAASRAWDDLPRGSFVAFHAPVGQFALYLRTIDGLDAPEWTDGPIYGPDRDALVVHGAKLWRGHCDYHGISYSCGEELPLRRKRGGAGE